MYNALSKAFGQASGVLVHHDLMAAAMALCGNAPGIACILGTGSNACFFDGERIVREAVNLGWALGDEGSGGHIGRMLVQAYLYGDMPDVLATTFRPMLVDSLATTDQDLSAPVINYEDETELRGAVIDRVYRQPYPNRWMASLAPFALQDHPGADWRSDEWVDSRLHQYMGQFIETHVRPLQELARSDGHGDVPVHATGGVAKAFQVVWQEALLNAQCIPGRILERPINGLLPPHLRR